MRIKKKKKVVLYGETVVVKEANKKFEELIKRIKGKLNDNNRFISS